MASIHKRIVLPLSALTQGVSRFDYNLQQPEIEYGDGCHFPDPVKTEVSVQLMNGEFLVEVRAESKGLFVCDRCGEEFQQLISGEMRILYTTDSEMVDEEREDDIRYLSTSITEVDVTQDVLDALLLAVPNKVICQNECKGLCSGCGANLNEESCQCVSTPADPRWDGLKNLKFDE